MFNEKEMSQAIDGLFGLFEPTDYEGYDEEEIGYAVRRRIGTEVLFSFTQRWDYHKNPLLKVFLLRIKEPLFLRVPNTLLYLILCFLKLI